MLLLGLSAAALFGAAWRWTRYAFRSDGAAFVTFFSFLIFAVPVTLGFLTILRPEWVTAVSFGILGLAMVFPGGKGLTPFTAPVRPSFLTLALGAIVVFVATRPVWSLVWSHVRWIHPFNPDALVTVPMMIDVVQSGSLWTSRSDLSFYLIGYEMVQAWGALFLGTDALYGAIHYAYLVGLLYYTLKLFRLFSPATSKVYLWVSAVVLLIILVRFEPLRDWVYGPFGKTDLPSICYAVMGVFHLARFYGAPDFRNRTEIFLASAAITLMVCVKAQASYLGLVFSVTLLVSSLPVWRRWGMRTAVAFLPLILALPFYFRFLRGMGSGTASQGSKSSILAVLFLDGPSDYASIYGPDFQAALREIFDWSRSCNQAYVGCIGLALGALIFWKRLRPMERFGVSLLAANIAVFTVSPLVVWSPCIQTRYSLAMLPLAFVLVGSFVSRHWAADPGHAGWSPMRGPAAGVGGLILLGALQVGAYAPRDGFPGYAGTYLDLSPSGLYRWAYDHIQNQSIYYYGARGFGLYGRGFANHLYHDREISKPIGLGSAERMIEGIRQFKPDYFVYQRASRLAPQRAAGPPPEMDLVLARSPDYGVAFADANGLILERKK